MEETFKKFGVALAAVIVVLVLLNVLLTKLGEMTLDRATKVGVLEKTIDDASEDLAKALKEAEAVKEKLSGLQSETEKQAKRNSETKIAIDNLAGTLSNVEGAESKTRLETIQRLVESLEDSESAELLLQLEDKISAPRKYYFTGSLATPTEWMAAAIAKDDFSGFCASLGKEYVSHNLVQKHYNNKQGNGYFYKDWYYAGPEFCAGDEVYWFSDGNDRKNIPTNAYSVRKYSGNCGCCIDTQHGGWGMEASAVVTCK